MDTIETGRFFAAAIAVLPLFGVGLGLGNLVSSMLAAVAKNPEAKNDIFQLGLIGLAFTEAIGLFSLAVAFAILFK